jgi:hypothetical protein
VVKYLVTAAKMYKRGKMTEVVWEVQYTIEKIKKRMCPFDTDAPAPNKFLDLFSPSLWHSHKFCNFILHKGA